MAKAVQLHKRMSKEAVETVLRSFNKGEISEEEACYLLGIKRARLYRLRNKWLSTKNKEEFTLYSRKKWVEKGMRLEIEQFLHEHLRYIREEAKYSRGQFNFAFLSEEVHKRFNVIIDRSVLRRFAIRHGYYTPIPGKRKKACTRFETAGPGMLFQHDSSIHRWLPFLEGEQALIMTKDDYSRKVVGALLVPKETTWDHLCVVRSTVEKYGAPVAYYVDNHSIFRFTQHDGIHMTYTRKQDEGRVQFKRALQAMGTNVIHTSAGPQAKGKIEKMFDYFQRRLPYLCEKYKITELKDANVILEDLVGYYNGRRKHEETQEIPDERWKRAVESGKVYLHKFPEDLSLSYVFSLHYLRTVNKDGTINFEGKHWKSGGVPGEKLTLCLLPGFKFMLYRSRQKLQEYHL